MKPPLLLKRLGIDSDFALQKMTSKNAQKGSRKHRTALHLTALAVTLGLGIITLGFEVAWADKIAPNTFMANSAIGLQDREAVENAYTEALIEFEQQPIVITFKEQSHTFTLTELGMTLDHAASLQMIPAIQWGSSPWSIEGGLFGYKQLQAQFDFNEKQFHNAIQEQWINLEVLAQEARFVWNTTTGDIQIIEDQPGWKADVDTLMKQFIEHIRTLRTDSNLELVTFDVFPETTAEALTPYKETLRPKLDQVTTIKHESDTWDIAWREHLEWITFEKEEIQLTQGFTDHIRQTVAPDIEIASQDVTILMETKEKIWFEGSAVDGIQIQVDALVRLTELALNQNVQHVKIPLQITRGKVNAPQELVDLGITELVATGYTGYHHSTANRMHNIGVAMSRFDGALIAPGETLSFGKQLGIVDGSTGYRKELVIKEDRTIPEYGGGVCQVSSTMFRAALNAGLPIVERHNHSYAVSYYAYPNGYGLDATVYPPSVDLQFTNDTGHHILIQAYLPGAREAYVKFYGTRDGRTVNFEGPTISKRVPALPTEYIVTDEKAQGEMEKIDGAVAGFTADWTRTVTYPDGRIEGYSIHSPYQARGEKWLVGRGTEGFEEE